MASMLRHRRAQGPMPLGLVLLMATVITVAIVTVWYFMFYEGNPNTGADHKQLEQLQKLVNEISIVSKSGATGSRIPITLLPGRGIVFLRLPPAKVEVNKESVDLADKIYRAGGCKEFCLCAIKREKAYTDEPNINKYYTRATIRFGNADKPAFLELLADKDTKILKCVNIRAVAIAASGHTWEPKNVILTDYVSDDNLNKCSYCKDNWKSMQMSSYWGLPLYWKKDTRQIAILSSTCSLTPRVWVTRDWSAGALIINTQVFNEYQPTDCTFYRCYPASLWGELTTAIVGADQEALCPY